MSYGQEPNSTTGQTIKNSDRLFFCCSDPRSSESIMPCAKVIGVSSPFRGVRSVRAFSPNTVGLRDLQRKRISRMCVSVCVFVSVCIPMSISTRNILPDASCHVPTNIWASCGPVESTNNTTLAYWSRTSFFLNGQRSHFLMGHTSHT